jgi:stage V sporulation protein G
MHITEVRIVLRDDVKLKAFATITLDYCFVVRGLRIIHSSRGLFVAMPARRKANGAFQDVAHPIHADMRAELERAVIAEYMRTLRSGGRPGQSNEPDFADGDIE